MVMALITALTLNYLHKRRPYRISQGEAYGGLDDSKKEVIEHLNFQLNLNTGVKNANAEITVLQTLINDYHGTNVLIVNGNFDGNTKQEVRRITGKFATTLWEFMYIYYIPKKSERRALDIIEELKQNSNEA